MSDATSYNWRKRYGRLMPSEIKRLRQLEEENAKLKRIVADLSLDKAVLQDVLAKNSEARPQASARRQGESRLEGLDATRLFGAEDRSVALCLQVQSRRAGRPEAEDQGHLPNAGARWLSRVQAASVQRPEIPECVEITRDSLGEHLAESVSINDLPTDSRAMRLLR
ncbi:hypothetical protein HGP14_31995 [Rhizobium sp. P32RR-XVIII]|nr:hypothetical protein [Rhizobium sp. P32RR-XVIII]